MLLSYVCRLYPMFVDSILCFFESHDLRATSKLTTKTHGRVESRPSTIRPVLLRIISVSWIV